MFPRIPLLQRFIFADIVRVFLFVLSCITILLMFVGVFQQATESGLGPVEVLKILPYVVPSMLPFTIPAALLLTVSVVYGRLAGDQEITAAKAAGIHPVTLMWPALFLGGCLSVCSLVMTDQVIPWSVSKIERHVALVMEDIFLDRLKSELQFSDYGHGVHVTVSGVRGRTLMHPVISYVRDRRMIRLQAEQAEIHFDLAQRQAIVKLSTVFADLGDQGKVYLGRQRTERIRWDGAISERKARHLPIAVIQQDIVQLQQSEETLRQRLAIEALMSLTVADFSRLPRAPKGSESFEMMRERHNKMNTEIHSRYALACSCFFFALLGTPFSILYGKNQFLTSFLFCFVPIVGVYYPLMLGLMTQAKMGHVAPQWAVWVANVLLGVAAWCVMRRVIRY